MEVISWNGALCWNGLCLLWQKGEKIMLYDCHLNHMNEDELRNYAHKQKELVDSYGELLYAKDKVIESLQNLFNAQQFAEKRLMEFIRRRDEIARTERTIREKYDKHIERPVCDGSN